MHALPATGHAILADASVRTRVIVPLRFSDGFSVTAHAVTFHGLADVEHVALVLGDPVAAGVPLVRLHSGGPTRSVTRLAPLQCHSPPGHTTWFAWGPRLESERPWGR